MTEDFETMVEQRGSGALAETMPRAEIDRMIEMAHRFPRVPATAMMNIRTSAVIDDETALECIYAVPRDGKIVLGPSVRYAEMAVAMWGNCRVAARITQTDRAEKFVEAEGFFLDAEANVAQVASIRSRISGRGGRLFSDDMILMTGNAACSKARRNAILAGIPKLIWRPGYLAALARLRGSPDTLAARRAGALESLAGIGLEPGHVLRLLAVRSVDEIDIDKLLHLRGLYSAVGSGETTVMEIVSSLAPEKPERITAVTAQHVAPAVFDAADLPSADAPAQPAKKARKPRKPKKPKEVA